MLLETQLDLHYIKDKTTYLTVKLFFNCVIYYGNFVRVLRVSLSQWCKIYIFLSFISHPTSNIDALF